MDRRFLLSGLGSILAAGVLGPEGPAAAQGNVITTFKQNAKLRDRRAGKRPGGPGQRGRFGRGPGGGMRRRMRMMRMRRQKMMRRWRGVFN